MVASEVQIFPLVSVLVANSKLRFDKPLPASSLLSPSVLRPSEAM